MHIFCRTSVLILFLFGVVMCSKPLGKRQLAAWRLECEMGVISDPECPVDGGWASWEPWSDCQGVCDDIGHRRRTRQCINPPPSEDGIPCSGPDEEIQPCYITNCTVQDFQTLISGDLARMDAYHELEAFPALMERCLQKECEYSALKAFLASDNTWRVNPERLWNSLQCVKHNLGCPVVGEWGSWGPWSECGARCGNGMRWRLRQCDTPPPSNARLICQGIPLETKPCRGYQCVQDLTDINLQPDKEWSLWSSWTPCSEKCGVGITRRHRSCLEKSVTRYGGTWGTHCVGPHNMFNVCRNNKCVLDGGWSGWATWGPCSQICGAGKRARTRSCTRPEPAGGGKDCDGPRTEFGSCYMTPCEAYTHVVAVLNGESFLQYNFNKHFTLFHFYVRFRPLSPHGTLVRRGTVHSPTVRLSLQKWHVCLDASGTSSSCTIPRICSPAAIDAAVWHSVLITVSTEAAYLRLDDDIAPIKAFFPCDPNLLNDKMNILVGERFHGEVQELVLNFIPLDVINERQWRTTRSDFVPSSSSNIAFEKANLEEAFLHLHSGQYLRVPCFSDQSEWQLELTFRSQRESGTILFLRSDPTESWLYMGLQNTRLKLKAAIDDFRYESSSTMECLPDQWLDIMLIKKRGSNTIEALINSGERLHIPLDETVIKWRQLSKTTQTNSTIQDHDNYFLNYFKGNKNNVEDVTPFPICVDEFFVGGTPADTKHDVPKHFIPFSGVIAAIRINNVLQNIHDFSVERYRADKVQLSSRTASVSGSYHETSWGNSNRLNLTCLHARSPRSNHFAQWLYLDTSIKDALRNKTVHSVDDGRVLRLIASADNDLRGFYTCRSQGNKRTQNIVTYGVIGKIVYSLSSPDFTTAVAVVSTVLLAIATLAWLLIEGLHDLREGFGFFRDAHLTPEQEAEAVCNYIDNHVHLIGSKSAAELAKAKARRKGKQLSLLASEMSFAAQEPQGLLQFENQTIQETSSEANSEFTSELLELPPLPGNQKNAMTPDVYTLGESYVSSPRHATIMSLQTELTSSSSFDQKFELVSPRVLCNRLLLKKTDQSPGGSVPRKSRRTQKCSLDVGKKRSNLFTIKSSGLLNFSPGQKILARFQQLNTEDN